ncbi:MAG: cache domain-containing protein [Lachnospiraceae bacterium]|nr:cache domain-containing protein [Lachnospiraceae bacterium]
MNKKVRVSLRKQLLFMSIVPCVLLALFITFIAISKTKEGMKNETMLGLQGMVTSMTGAYNGLAEGDYYIEDGCLMKGDLNITENMDVLDAMVEGTDYDITIFYGKTRMATTLISNETKQRIVGTDANDKVVETVLNKGKEYKNYNTQINGENYYVYYTPLKDSTGNVIGMMFAGIPSKEAESYVNSIIKSISIGIAVVEAIIIVVSIIITVGIVRSIESAEAAIHILSQGNLNFDVNPKYINRTDEIGDMLRALRNFVEKLKEILGDIHQSSKIMIDSGKNLEDMAQNTSTTTQEINCAVGDISQGAVTQAEEIENANIYVANIGEVIENIVKSVSELDRNAARMKDAGDESAKIIKELEASNDQTTEALDKIGNQVYATNASVQSIKEAIALISSIAEETNLLSLNASIEAARAGEHGKGFAVVASEIQKLAEQSNESSTRIEEIVDSLLMESELMVEVMEEVKIIVDQQQRKLDDTKAKFEDVEEGINICWQKTEGIKGQTKACNESREQVVDVIQGLSAISEENAASTQQTYASMEELNSFISVMANAAGELMNLSEKLDADLRFFKLSAGE